MEGNQVVKAGAKRTLVELTELEAQWIADRRRRETAGYDDLGCVLLGLDAGLTAAAALLGKVKLLEFLSGWNAAKLDDSRKHRALGKLTARLFLTRIVQLLLVTGLPPLRVPILGALADFKNPLTRAFQIFLAPFHHFSYPAAVLYSARLILPPCRRMVSGRFGRARSPAKTETRTSQKTAQSVDNSPRTPISVPMVPTALPGEAATHSTPPQSTLSREENVASEIKRLAALAAELNTSTGGQRSKSSESDAALEAAATKAAAGIKKIQAEQLRRRRETPTSPAASDMSVTSPDRLNIVLGSATDQTSQAEPDAGLADIGATSHASALKGLMSATASNSANTTSCGAKKAKTRNFLWKKKGAMATPVAALESTARDLETLLGASSPDLAKAKQYIVQLKIGITKLDGLQPGASVDEQAVRELQLARRVAELAASTAILNRDMPAFERAAIQAKEYYLDYSKNRIAELHTELELISTVTTVVGQAIDRFISYSLELEKLVMEGSYAKIAAQTNALPDPHYGWFLEMLLSTVRCEVADCTERAYQSLPLDYAVRLMLLSTTSQLKTWVNDEGRGTSWKIDESASKVSFAPISQTAPVEGPSGPATCALDAAVPAVALIHRALDYAKELERII